MEARTPVQMRPSSVCQPSCPVRGSTPIRRGPLPHRQNQWRTSTHNDCHNPSDGAAAGCIASFPCDRALSSRHDPLHTDPIMNHPCRTSRRTRPSFQRASPRPAAGFVDHAVLERLPTAPAIRPLRTPDGTPSSLGGRSSPQVHDAGHTDQTEEQDERPGRECGHRSSGPSESGELNRVRFTVECEFTRCGS